MSKTVQNVSKCSDCNSNPAEFNSQFGWVACKSCREQTTRMSERTYEFVPEHIKLERQEFKTQTLQPFRNGQLSKEYVQAYGTKHIKVSDEEVKNAKNVWGELSYYKE